MKEEHIWFSLIVGFILIILSAVITSHIEQNNYIKNGYCQYVVPGKESKLWEKCKEN